MEPCLDSAHHLFREAIAPGTWSNWILAVMACVAGWIAIRTMRAIQHQATAQMNADRAWVVANVAGSPQEPLTGSLIHGVVPGIAWEIKIVGNTPARIIRQEFRCRIVDCQPTNISLPMLEPTPVYLPNQTPEGLMVSPPGDKPVFMSIVESEPNITLMARLSQVVIGHAFLVSYGRVEYEDAFKRRGVTQFCTIYKPHSGGVLTSPDGTALNPTGFHIAGPSGYNYNT